MGLDEGESGHGALFVSVPTPPVIRDGQFASNLELWNSKINGNVFFLLVTCYKKGN